MNHRIPLVAFAFLSLAGVVPGSALAEDAAAPSTGRPDGGSQVKFLAGGQDAHGRTALLLRVGGTGMVVALQRPGGTTLLETLSSERGRNQFKVDTLELGLMIFNTGPAARDGVIIPGHIGFRAERSTQVLDRPVAADEVARVLSAIHGLARTTADATPAPSTAPPAAMAASRPRVRDHGPSAPRAGRASAVRASRTR